MLFTIKNTTIHWSTKLQIIVALSMIEAKYMALLDGARKILWIHTLLSKLRKQQK